MGHIIIDHFPEYHFIEKDFGFNRPALLNAQNDTPKRLALNPKAVAGYETVMIETNRPGPPNTKSDKIKGVRIRSSWGQHFIIFDDLSQSFEKVLEETCQSEVNKYFTTDDSKYFKQFGIHPSSAKNQLAANS
ncbi:hypothetical protein [Methylophaga thalassica]|uniref:hypothetical protein n=1 Tax=Methylophaga thalassica TaxID=40223 RepID=UPI002E7AF791|nr:hypothetical protein [Methylophaga thalassica]WVI83639.1 hypothetical protein VSX76_00910 [Methylophaga thalassica]